MTRLPALAVFVLLLGLPGVASAEEAGADANGNANANANTEAGACSAPAAADGRRGIGFELNVLWPFFPGGITELRVMIPLLRPDRRDFRGELVLGAYSDFASRVIRDETYGKVANYSGKLGWRQFIVYGLHAEVSANAGLRHEENRPPDNVTIDGFQIRLWGLAGYQHEFSRVVYANARGGLGIHIYRSDEYASLEKKLVPGADVNLGFRF
jgi:hypothetical protein